MSEEKMQIVICLGSSCFSRGNRDTLEVIKDYLKVNQLSANVLFKGQLCSQSCNKGPVIWINDVKYEAITATNVIPLLDQMFLPAALQ
ncbi:MAG: NAD(P)H-dependent oxidoreductase subunit E [Bacteroidales bacterium]|mgnify:CR=1 FL=1